MEDNDERMKRALREMMEHLFETGSLPLPKNLKDKLDAADVEERIGHEFND